MMDKAPDRCGRAPAGFTLVEVLISISIISILLAILLPALRHTRDSASDVASAANVRTHVAVMAMYAADFADQAPFFTKPNEIVLVHSPPVTIRVEYFLAYGTWNMALAPGYYDGQPTSTSFFYPGYAEHIRAAGYFALYSMYWYSSSFLADPDYWTVERRQGPEQWRSTKLSDVVAPSGKGIIRETKPTDLGMPQSWFDKPAIGFVDGSVRRVALTNILPGHPNGTGVREGGAMLHDSPIMHTINGVRGRDVN